MENVNTKIYQWFKGNDKLAIIAGAIAGATAGGLFSLFVLSIIPPRLSTDVTKYSSPCQCLLKGGCVMPFTVNTGMYDDRTRQSDYDTWGLYSGPVDVPDKCRSSKSRAEIKK